MGSNKMEGLLTGTLLLLSAMVLQTCALTQENPKYCGVPLKDRRIVGGVPAKDFQFPWQVPLLSNTWGSIQFICSGTLLSTWTVLTAGHCVNINEEIYVGFPNGSVSRNDALIIPSGSIAKHPYYHYDGRDSPINDFAIITLSEPVNFGKGIIPICLPDPNSNYEDKKVTVSGWGYNENWILPEDLKTTNMTTMNNKECQEKSVGTWKVKSSMLCAISEDSNTCGGDSGGPMIVLEQDSAFYTQIGVTSWGNSNCDVDIPAVFARVTNQLYWIFSQIQGATLPAPVPRPTSYSGSGDL